MHKLLVLYPPQPDTDAFEAYYADRHVPLARNLPGLKALRYSFDVEMLGGDGRFACVFEADFADAAALGAAMASPEGQAVAGDVANFADVPPTILHYATRGEAAA